MDSQATARQHSEQTQVAPSQPTYGLLARIINWQRAASKSFHCADHPYAVLNLNLNTMTMAQTQQVLRLKRTDLKSEHLLVNVTRQGPSDLDLKLIATDQKNLYHASLKEASVKKLQAPNFTGDLEQLKTTLSFALLHRSPGGARPDFLQGVETVSSISGTTATITFRKNIDGITQRLGTIEFKQNDEPEIDVFDWVDCAVATSDDLRAQLESLQESASSQQDQIAKLTKDLDDLVKAKKKHEDEMLSKFAALLNAKKLKIRDQQRLLNGAHVDANAAEEVSNARTTSSKPSRRAAGASRAGKRKVNAARELVEEDVDENDAQTEATDNGEEGKERLRQETPETEDGDATDDESNGIGDAAEDSHMITRKSNAPMETMDVDGGGSTSLARRGKDREEARNPNRPPISNAADDDDETDDEL